MADEQDIDIEIEEEGDEEEYEEEVEGEEGGDGEEAAESQEVEAGIGALKDVADKSFDEVRLPADVVKEAQEVWQTFLSSASSREAAGEAIYAALFDSAPSLQSLFKTPRAVMAMRFMNGLNQIITSVHDPKSLKVVVETLGFQHLDLEVTIPRVVIFRDAIVELLMLEMDGRTTQRAKDGWMTVLNYVGGAYIYVRVKFAERLRVLSSSRR